jgi:hypothetical protein
VVFEGCSDGVVDCRARQHGGICSLGAFSLRTS